MASDAQISGAVDTDVTVLVRNAMLSDEVLATSASLGMAVVAVLLAVPIAMNLYPRASIGAVLRKIAQELVAQVRANATVDWSVRESSKARMRLTVKKLLRKYKYPPDKQERATQLVLEQAEVVSMDWAE